MNRSLPGLRTWRRLAATATLVAAATLPAAAAPGLADFQHTHWTADNGAPPQIRAMAQTSDGWLWFGTADGLYRFDGLRFERYPLPPRPGLSSDRIGELHAAANGDLYISYMGEGLVVLHPDGRVEELPAQAMPVDTIGAMAVDTDGSVWTISRGIQRLRGGRWEVVDDDPSWGGSNRRNLVLDRQGRLWAANERGVWRLDRASGRFARVLDAGGDLLLAPDGSLWLAAFDGAMRLVDAGGGARPAWYAHSEGRYTAQFAGDGTLWLLRCPQAVCLVEGAGARTGAVYRPVRAATARLAPATRLSGQEPNIVLEDREGSIWVATEKGLDRFRRNRLLQTGLAGSGVHYSMAVDANGQAWAANGRDGTLWRLHPDGSAVRETGRQVAVIANGRDGALLVGEARAIERRTRDGVERIPLPPGPDGKPVDRHVLGVLDDGKVLWTASLETGLIGWRDGAWLPRSAFTLPDKIYQSAPGAAPGQLWLATAEGALVRYDDGKLARFDMRAIGMATAIFPGAELTISGSKGFAVLKGGTLRLLRAADPNVLRNVSGMVVTPDGDRWLNGAGGVVHVRAGDWRRSMADPDLALRYEVFDSLDGYPGQAAITSRWASAVSPDGRRIWLAATGGVALLDTGALRRNQVAPRPVILNVADSSHVYPAQPLVRLPAGASQFRIQFTAPALRLPERVHFEYRLDGVDSQWIDAGPRRATSYTNVEPGSYVFRVRTRNEDGVPGAAEASMRLEVAPTLMQSPWFKAACVLALVLLAAALYRYRVRYLTARLTEKLEVKTAERERIARTLHDTFLQTVQGLVLRVDAVAATLPEHDRARQQLETVLTDASHAIGEGRDQLQELRSGDAHVLENLLDDTIARLRGRHEAGCGPVAVELRVDGERRRLLGPVADEIADIAREALRNAFTHAGARHIRVSLAYGRRTLALTVSDDGRGIAADVMRDGYRSGHWGLVGMRERAGRIGARLDIDSRAKNGTTVTLVVPGLRAYAAE